ncbi:hypothetical protein BU17DRAFT_100735 [Hysterangium stoloniferum]|nr:hypothetical protein BU17DRAFT_100735 [Hysterangium stoloniferum]
MVLAKKTLPDVSLNNGKDSQFFIILDIPCHCHIEQSCYIMRRRNNRGYSDPDSCGSPDLGPPCTTVRSFNTIAILVSLLIHWDAILDSIKEGSMIDYEGLVLTAKSFLRVDTALFTGASVSSNPGLSGKETSLAWGRSCWINLARSIIVSLR